MNKNKLKLLSLFSGIGAFEKALSNINIEYDLVGFCEIDNYAIESYCAIHNTTKDKNLGDISKANLENLKNQNIDLIVGGSPCQDFSCAGKQKGSIWTCNDCGHEYNPLTVNHNTRNYCPICNSLNLEKTRSSLVVEMLRVIKVLKPKYVVYENVKSITNKKFKNTFDLFLDELNEYGYNTSWKVLNAKDYNLPQNRERVFVIATLKDLPTFNFPTESKLETRLKDLLEDCVDERYYINKPFKVISNKLYVDTNNLNTFKSNEDIDKCNQVALLEMHTLDMCKRVYDVNYIAPTLTTMQGGNAQPKILCIGNKNPGKRGLSGNIYSEKGISATITTAGALNILTSNNIDKTNSSDTLLRVRKLTPIECWRLMGFDDSDFVKAKNLNISNTQLYKQAGNSICVTVLEAIFKELLKNDYNLNSNKGGDFNE